MQIVWIPRDKARYRDKDLGGRGEGLRRRAADVSP